jgi:tRNA dimethylallyltransferase
LVEEVRRLRERTDLVAEHPSMRAVGYRQVWQYLDGMCALDAARERAIAATRQLAKRQLTWMRARQAAVWFDSVHPEVASTVARALSEGGV